jgi:hypothetical protein
MKKSQSKKKHKEKVDTQRFKDQLEDAWHLIRKRKKLKRKQLFNTFTTDKKKD